LAHKVYIDIDMIASQNYVRGVWSALHTDLHQNLTKQCEKAKQILTQYFDNLGLPTTDFPFNGRSDYQAFLDQGIPSTGVITGEDEIKTKEQVKVFGGINEMVLDPCYHQDCDRVEKIVGPSMEILSQNLGALSHALEYFTKRLFS
jgi:Zn-dependent M28 family amino/carboxypeptidase